MSFSNLVAEALLHPERREDCERQMTCKLQASQRISCSCGSILDEKTVSVLEVSNPNDPLDELPQTIVCACPGCRKSADQHLLKLLHDKSVKVPGDVYTWLTWDDAQVVDATLPLPSVRNVPGLAVVRQEDTLRGIGKYHVVHVDSDMYLARTSSLKASWQLLAQLKGLADWTLEKHALRSSIDEVTRQKIDTVVKYYGV